MSVQFQVGDKAIVRFYSRSRWGVSVDPEPLVTEVVRVSKTGQPSIEAENPDGMKQKIRFNPRDAWTEFDVQGLASIGEPYGRFKQSRLFHHSEELLAKINDHIAEQQIQVNMKKATDAVKEQERKDRHDAEVAEVKAAWATKDLRNPTSFGDVMPDGSRVYTLDIPVKAEYVERKLGWERIIVRCKDVEDYDWDRLHKAENEEDAKVRRVEMAMTYCNGSSHSFTSCSTEKHDSDEDGLWEAMRHCYHSR